MGGGSATAAWRLGLAGEAEPFVAAKAGRATLKRATTVMVWRDYGVVPRLIV
jgi:hypothetical protein